MKIVQLPHFQQSAPGYCLATCARMSLAGINRLYTEAQLDRAMGGSGAGVPSFAVQRLERLNLHVNYRKWTLPELEAALESNIPVIAFVNTQFLDTWDVASSHAVIIVGIEKQERFYIHDPDSPSGPDLISWHGFLAAWFEYDQRGATIRPKDKRR